MVRRSGGTVLTRSPAGAVSRFRPAVAGSFVAPTFADSPTGTLLFGGLVPFEQVGSTTIPIVSGRRLPLARGIRDRAAMRRYVVAAAATAAPVVFLDSQTGSLIFAGSGVEARVGADSATGALVFVGSRSEAKVGADARTGTLVWGGSRAETATFSQTATGTLIFSGSVVEREILPLSLSRVRIATFVRVS